MELAHEIHQEIAGYEDYDPRKKELYHLINRLYLLCPDIKDDLLDLVGIEDAILDDMFPDRGDDDFDPDSMYNI